MPSPVPAKIISESLNPSPKTDTKPTTSSSLAPTTPPHQTTLTSSHSSHAYTAPHFAHQGTHEWEQTNASQGSELSRVVEHEPWAVHAEAAVPEELDARAGEVETRWIGNTVGKQAPRRRSSLIEWVHRHGYEEDGGHGGHGGEVRGGKGNESERVE